MLAGIGLSHLLYVLVIQFCIANLLLIVVAVI